MNNTVNAQRSQYNRDVILTASPARLLTMLYDRLLLDLGRAEAAQLASNWAASTENLLHAQDIVAELSSSLDVDAWDGADGLLAVYNYVSNALISANVDRDVERTRESIALLEPLRTAWHEAAMQLPAPATAPAVSAHPEFATGNLGVG
ncbi:flagellar export chaperone FliS [Leifsonia sp. YAF41]|uniref:flagellar export chaperone FliS n=1 Tax=Leifsonia sp. YAF41 TaxID=3233086 RepID=UPI003F96D5A4